MLKLYWCDSCIFILPPPQTYIISIYHITKYTHLIILPSLSPVPQHTLVHTFKSPMFQLPTQILSWWSGKYLSSSDAPTRAEVTLTLPWDSVLQIGIGYNIDMTISCFLHTWSTWVYRYTEFTHNHISSHCHFQRKRKLWLYIPPSNSCQYM